MTVEGVTASVVKTIAKLAATELPALATFFGGIVAQEVVKYTGAVYRRLARLSPAQLQSHGPVAPEQCCVRMRLSSGLQLVLL